MKQYLSSYRFGDEADTLRLLGEKVSGPLGYISNALDFTTADPVRKRQHCIREMDELREFGFSVAPLDLRAYFGKALDLREHLRTLGGVYVCGGNCFVLRHAMHLSGFDTALRAQCKRPDFLYAGYSAGVCVLSPTLRPYALVDDATDRPYEQGRPPIWDGLHLLDFVFLPHYRSDHPDSAQIDQAVAYCVAHKIPFKAYRDGEVLVQM